MKSEYQGGNVGTVGLFQIVTKKYLRELSLMLEKEHKGMCPTAAGCISILYLLLTENQQM